MSDTRLRLGAQLAARRKQLGWQTKDLAQRLGRPSPRISEVETGRANACIDTLAEMGAVMQLSLVFVPESKLSHVLAMLGKPAVTPMPTTTAPPSVFDEVFIEDPDDE
jgi:transcriptional regulator with XRE-family HTH domain